MGVDLSLTAVISVILGSEREWKAFLTFCKDVMIRKEDEERRRRGKGTREEDRGRGCHPGRCRRLPAHLGA